MKKFTLVLLMLLTVLALAGCASSVAGKTYTYDSFEYEKAKGLTALEDAGAEIAITAAKALYENVEITFNEDGTTNLGQSWTQDGSKLTIGSTEYKVKGSKIVVEVETEDYSYVATFVVKK